MNCELKLLGDLQVYDIPYLSLYTDEASHTFYLAFLLSYSRGTSADYVVAPVSARMLIDYLKQQKSVRDLFSESKQIFLWHKQRGMKGELSLAEDRRLENKIDNSKYNPGLCEDEEVILDYLQGI